MLLIIYIFLYEVPANFVDFLSLSILPFFIKNPGNLYRHVIKFKSWPNILRFKKHKGISHCKDIPKNITLFRKDWLGISGIYKITYLPFRIFTYYGSSSNLGLRFKYHYYNGAKKGNFLGLFLSAFDWSKFSITVIETCPPFELATRENWYLSQYQPLLNVLMSSSNYPLKSTNLSLLTRSKISASLIGRKESDFTRTKKSKARKGILNPFYNKGPGKKALDLAAEKLGTKIYVYDSIKFLLVNNKPFRSIRMTANSLPISAGTLPSKLNTGKPFKGYYYYTEPQITVPK